MVNGHLHQVEKYLFGPLDCLPCARIIRYHLINTVSACHVLVIFINTFRLYNFFSLSTALLPMISFGSGAVVFCGDHFYHLFIHPRWNHHLSIVSGYHFILFHFSGIAYLWQFASVCSEGPHSVNFFLKQHLAQLDRIIQVVRE